MKQFVAPPDSGWPVEGREVRWGLSAVFLCLLGAQFFAAVWLTVAALGVYGSETLPSLGERPIWTMLLFNAGLWIGYLVGPVLAKRLTRSGPLVDFDLRASLPEAAVAVAVGVGAQLVLLPALYWVLLQFVSGDPGRTAEELTDRVDGGLDLALLVVAVVLIAPVVEEWFYRGMVLSTVARRFGPLAGAMGSSALFALVHQVWILMPGLFALAMILAWLTMKTARIGPAIVAHMAFNATTVIQLLVL